MKKIIQTSLFLFISAFAIGQSVTISPSQTTNQSNAGGENINVIASSNSMGIYGRRFNGTFAAKSPVLNGNELFRVSAGGWYTGVDESQHAAIKFNATENWNISSSGTKITFTTTPNVGTSQVERMVINHNGKVGIGNSSPLGKLHINHLATPTDAHLHLQSTGSSSAVIKATTTNAGEWENHFLTNASAASNVVYWTNSINSSTPLILTGEGDAIIERNASVAGRVSINSNAVPRGELDIIHNTTNLPTSPHINLKTSVNASNGMIRMENSTGSNYFGQYFSLNSGTPANNFVSFDYNGSTSILDMQGNGNVKVSGFTSLGNDAPKIKMKKLTGTTNAAQGGTSLAIAHGIADPTKIIAINVLVKYDPGSPNDAWVGNGYTGSAGYEFSYQYDGGNIYIVNTSGNSAAILSKAIKILVTYEE